MSKRGILIALCVVGLVALISGWFLFGLGSGSQDRKPGAELLANTAADTGAPDGTGGSESVEAASLPAPQTAGESGALSDRPRVKSQGGSGSAQMTDTLLSLEDRKQARDDQDSPPAMALTIERTASRPVSRDVSGVFLDLLGEAHPTLPLETRERISEIAGAALESHVGRVSRDRRDLLLQSIRLSQPEIANLPFDRSQEHLDWSVDSLENTCRFWGGVFSALTAADVGGGQGAATDGGAANGKLTQEMMRDAIPEICGEESDATDEIFAKLVGELDVVSDYYFTPEYKFSPSKERLAQFKGEFHREVAQAKARIGALKDELKSRMERQLNSERGLDGESVEERRRSAEQVYTSRLRSAWFSECGGLQSKLHMFHKGLVPEGFWDSARLPADYGDTCRSLGARRLELIRRDTAESLRRARAEMVGNQMDDVVHQMGADVDRMAGDITIEAEGGRQ